MKTSLKDIKKRLLGFVDVAVGVDDPSVMEYAPVMEYGSVVNNIPQRRFLTRSIAENQEIIDKQVRDLSKRVMDGSLDPDDATRKLGVILVTIVKGHINGGNFPPELKPSTIKAKGHSKQMIDTGALHDAIKYKVMK